MHRYSFEKDFSSIEEAKQYEKFFLEELNNDQELKVMLNSVTRINVAPNELHNVCKSDGYIDRYGYDKKDHDPNNFVAEVNIPLP